MKLKNEIKKYVEKIEDMVCSAGQKSIEDFEEIVLGIGKELIKRYRKPAN